ncbi:MAG: RluA family pseudouridine synthase [Rhodospirillales bacterium]|nr:RluA family pseudouridine synthase [Rhodospirillales bacterium]
MTPSNSATTFTVPVPENKAGNRLDRLLAEALGDLSRTRIKALILGGRVVLVDDLGTPATDPAYKVRRGQAFLITVPAPESALPEPENIPLNVVYEDNELIVIDKPAGLVVHPGAGNPAGTLVNALLFHCKNSLSGIGGVTRPGIVHRLDKDTSGLMVAAKTDLAHQDLSRQFEAHSLERAYLAVVWGILAPTQGEISGNIGRNPANRKKMAVVRRGGKQALTRYRTVRALGSVASLVECRLATGRTHQIRVHLSTRGHSVVGDPLYGGALRSRIKQAPENVRAALATFNRQALHAYILGFRHPSTNKTLRFESTLPHDINELIDCLDVM